jgi:hypothetical protein
LIGVGVAGVILSNSIFNGMDNGPPQGLMYLTLSS